MYKRLLNQQPPPYEQWPIKIDDIKAQEEKGQKVEKAPPKPCWEIHLPTFILCPKPIVPEWKHVINKYTKLKPHLHYGSEFWRANDHHEAINSSHPWQYIVIMTIETYYHWQGIVGYDRSIFWFPAASYGSCQAAALFLLEPQFKWMLTATSLVNRIEDLHWVLTFPPQDSWLAENLPLDTLVKAAMEPQVDDWQPNEMNPILSTEPDAEFTTIANPYQQCPQCGSLIHCTTQSWDW
ncbi:hypothetical protein BDD12DRAFT_802756 [Trichophaea hybrida]|nr:hypothetical protein BDD12DRAFT_802756 [Trichophaea hybrida]